MQMSTASKELPSQCALGMPELTRRFDSYLAEFRLRGDSGLFASSEERKTEVLDGEVAGIQFKKYVNEFWTARQRQALSVHEVSYRACFKPQLPAFFIELMSAPGDCVYDPFLGRGTTAVESAVRGRVPLGNDVNPLSRLLTLPRLQIPDLSAVEERLCRLDLPGGLRAEIDLSMFFHPDTESEIVGLKNYFLNRESSGEIDEVDRWIRMVASNRLTGHSVGFFSVYTLPPNQATSQADQVKINNKRGQIPTYRNTRKIILKKSAQLLSDIDEGLRTKINECGRAALIYTGDSRNTPQIKSGSVQLTVTSPPFLDIVSYAKDNWLRCWFNGINADAVGRGITMARTVQQWSNTMRELFVELYRVTRPRGYVAFEVGEVRKGSVKLDELVVPAGVAAGFTCLGVVINQQEFTKTANIWGVKNNSLGTNTNRIVIFVKAK